jgi:hypothetical protein
MYVRTKLQDHFNGCIVDAGLHKQGGSCAEGILMRIAQYSIIK